MNCIPKKLQQQNIPGVGGVGLVDMFFSYKYMATVTFSLECRVIFLLSKQPISSHLLPTTILLGKSQNAISFRPNRLRHRCRWFHSFLDGQIAPPERLYCQRNCQKSNDPKNSHLRELEGAEERLTLCKSDLLDYQSLREAIDGCDGVFHTASPVTDDPFYYGFCDMGLMAASVFDLKEEMVEPAVNGTKNVIIAAAEVKVRRVVFTSSIGAVTMDPNRSPDAVVDESCWSDLEFCKSTKEDVSLIVWWRRAYVGEQEIHIADILFLYLDLPLFLSPSPPHDQNMGVDHLLFQSPSSPHNQVSLKQRRVRTKDLLFLCLDRPLHYTIKPEGGNFEQGKIRIKDSLYEQNWYCYGKAVAEQAASNEAKERGVDLVVVNPVLVLGPLLQPTLNASIIHVLKYLNGSAKTYANSVQAYVDVKDVALAHILVFENPSASGRYLCAESVLHRGDVVEILAKLFPEYPIPTKCKDETKPRIKPYKFSNQKLKDLGLEFTPVRQSLYDTVKSLQEKE
ncbi:unnamed protein product [Camellia sinensis]